MNKQHLKFLWTDVFSCGPGRDDSHVQNSVLHHPDEGETAEGGGWAVGCWRCFPLPLSPQSGPQTPPPAPKTLRLLIHRSVTFHFSPDLILTANIRTAASRLISQPLKSRNRWSAGTFPHNHLQRNVWKRENGRKCLDVKGECCFKLMGWQ